MKQKRLSPRQVTPRKSPVQQRSRDKVERILDAAATLLEEKGYDHLTTASIATQAGCSVGSLYQYFPNKYAIVSSLVEKWLALDNEVLDQVEASNTQYDSVVEEFEALTRKLVRAYSKQTGLFALVTLIRIIPELHEMTEKHDRQFAVRLTKIMDSYLPDGDRAERLALAGYYTIVLDAVAMSIAEETPKRSRIKTRLLMKSVRDLFSGDI